jgi:hypothetical protein
MIYSALERKKATERTTTTTAEWCFTYPYEPNVYDAKECANCYNRDNDDQ